MVDEVNSIREISCLSAMKNPDESCHLTCYKHHVYSYMVAKKIPYEILFYGALENTRDIENFTYEEKGFKWHYKTSYLNEEDWFMTGVYAERAKKKFDFDEFIDMAKHEIDKDHPVLFFAPGGSVPFFKEIASINETGPELFTNVHYFMICGYDNAKDTLKFFEAPFGQYVYEQAVDDVRAGYLSCADKWFNDAYALYHLDNTLDLDKAFSQHEDFLTAHDDDLHLYDRIYDSVEFEFLIVGEVHEKPFLHAISLLYGSRALFKQFVDVAGYSEEIKETMKVLVKALRKLDTDSHAMIIRKNPNLIDSVKAQVLFVKSLERKLINDLKTSLLRRACWDKAMASVA